MLRRRPAVPSPEAPALRRAFRSAAALEAIRSHAHPSTTDSSSSSSSGTDDQAPSASLALYNYPTFAGAYAALAAHLFHRRVPGRLLVLPFSSVEPFRVEDFEAAGFQTCYLLDFIGPKKFAFELARFVPSVIAFDHRQSTLARIPQLGPCPSNVELHIDTTKTSARAVFDYFSKKLVATTPDLGMCDNLLEQEDQERVSNVLEYIEDADLRRWQLPNTKEFQTALRGERAKLNCITNPHVFDQLLQLDVCDLLTRGKSLAHDLLQAATKFIHKPFKIKLGRGSYGACLAYWSSGFHAAWYPKDLLEDY
ncbi:hypothetical protein QOZ80_9BG0699900 [Eleusine coracana subsp. coracana]|nr:hypothetical protein QOZ80_9BG0699900 [Eleusine coracana subsp. coracana]